MEKLKDYASIKLKSWKKKKKKTNAKFYLYQYKYSSFSI